MNLIGLNSMDKLTNRDIYQINIAFSLLSTSTALTIIHQRFYQPFTLASMDVHMIFVWYHLIFFLAICSQFASHSFSSLYLFGIINYSNIDGKNRKRKRFFWIFYIFWDFLGFLVFWGFFRSFRGL